VHKPANNTAKWYSRIIDWVLYQKSLRKIYYRLIQEIPRSDDGHDDREGEDEEVDDELETEDRIEDEPDHRFDEAVPEQAGKVPDDIPFPFRDVQTDDNTDGSPDWHLVYSTGQLSRQGIVPELLYQIIAIP
jgi:hypothetical protein